MTTITNTWQTLEVQKNGVTVQRKFAGLNTQITVEDEVKFCRINYWYRELYPNNEVIKTELKSYTLQDLAESVETREDGVYKQSALAVLTGFVNNLGYAGIINPALDTLANHIILPIDAEEGYPLRRDTREWIKQ